MIADDSDFLPLEAAPYFVKLITFFNRSLEDTIELFKTEKNDAAFAKVLDYFVNDFDYYQANHLLAARGSNRRWRPKSTGN